MKKERYIVEIEMPDSDAASSTYIHDVIQSDCDIENEYRWKISVKEYWKPSDEQMDALETAVSTLQSTALESLYQKLNKLM